MRRTLIANCLAVILLLVAVAVAAPSIATKGKGLPLRLHTRVTLTGQTLGSREGEHASGRVFATARWNNGGRYVVATPPTDASGRWRITFHPSHRGVYKLRVLTPDHGVLDYSFDVR